MKGHGLELVSVVAYWNNKRHMTVGLDEESIVELRTPPNLRGRGGRAVRGGGGGGGASAVSFDTTSSDGSPKMIFDVETCRGPFGCQRCLKQTPNTAKTTAEVTASATANTANSILRQHHGSYLNPLDVRLFLPATCAYVPTLVLEVWAAGKLVGAASLNGEELVASANIMRLNASVMHPSALGAGLKQRPGQRATPHKVTTKALDSGGALIGISTALKDFPEHLAAVAPKHAKPKLKVRAYSS